MLTKAIYTINIMLMLFCSYSVVDLWRQMSHQDTRTAGDRGVQWITVQKNTLPWVPDARNFFDSKPIEIKKPAPPALPASAPEVALNEKGLADFTLRVRGIFTSQHQRFAVIDKISKKTSKQESVKAFSGDMVVGFAVKKIQPDVVTMVDSTTGETIILKIFKPPQSSPPSITPAPS
jgi:hypothetical protein